MTIYLFDGTMDGLLTAVITGSVPLITGAVTPKEMPVSLANWRIPAPITLAEISISLRLTLSRLCTIKGFSCDQWNRPLITNLTGFNPFV